MARGAKGQQEAARRREAHQSGTYAHGWTEPDSGDRPDDDQGDRRSRGTTRSSQAARAIHDGRVGQRARTGQLPGFGLPHDASPGAETAQRLGLAGPESRS